MKLTDSDTLPYLLGMKEHEVAHLRSIMYYVIYSDGAARADVAFCKALLEATKDYA